MKSQMRYLLLPGGEDPVKWAGTLVKTWIHFIFFGGILSYLTYDIVMNAAARNPNQVIYGALLIIFFELMILYGLRKLYLIITEKNGTE